MMQQASEDSSARLSADFEQMIFGEMSKWPTCENGIKKRVCTSHSSITNDKNLFERLFSLAKNFSIDTRRSMTSYHLELLLFEGAINLYGPKLRFNK
jgi:hypothetical protein